MSVVAVVFKVVAIVFEVDVCVFDGCLLVVFLFVLLLLFPRLLLLLLRLCVGCFTVFVPIVVEVVCWLQLYIHVLSCYDFARWFSKAAILVAMVTFFPSKFALHTNSFLHICSNF